MKTFTMSEYSNKEELYKAKAEYYEEVLKWVSVALGFAVDVKVTRITSDLVSEWGDSRLELACDLIDQWKMEEAEEI